VEKKGLRRTRVGILSNTFTVRNNIMVKRIDKDTNNLDWKLWDECLAKSQLAYEEDIIKFEQLDDYAASLYNSKINVDIS
jgi:hypothetical protein